MPLDVLVNATTATIGNTGTPSSSGTDAPAAGTVETWTDVTCDSTWPTLATGQQYRIIDEVDLGKKSGYEIMLVTANAIGTGVSWTVTRGVEGTTPWAHASGWTAVPAGTAAGLAGALLPPSGGGAVVYQPQGTSGNSSITPTVGQLVALPLLLPSGALAALCSAFPYGNASAICRIGLYDMADGIPTNLVVDGGAISGDASFSEVSISGVTLKGGLYAVAFNAQSFTSTWNQNAIQNISPTAGLPLPYSDISSGLPVPFPTGYISGTSVTSGGLPSSFGTVTLSNNMPWLAVKM